MHLLMLYWALLSALICFPYTAPRVLQRRMEGLLPDLYRWQTGAKAAERSTGDTSNLLREAGGPSPSLSDFRQDSGRNRFGTTLPTDDRSTTLDRPSGTGRLDRKPPRLQRLKAFREGDNRLPKALLSELQYKLRSPRRISNADGESPKMLDRVESNAGRESPSNLGRVGGQRFSQSSLLRVLPPDDIAEEANWGAIATENPHILTDEAESSHSAHQHSVAGDGHSVASDGHSLVSDAHSVASEPYSVLSDAHSVESDPVPESLAQYRGRHYDDGYESESDSDSDEWEIKLYKSQRRAVTYNPIFLSVMSEDHNAVTINERKLQESFNNFATAGKILTRLSADERAKKNPIDWKFLSEEYKNAWLKQIPPEHRTDQKVLDEIKRVKPQFRQLLTLSSRLATAEKEIEKAVVDEWKKFQSTLAKGLRKALKVYNEDETAKVVLSKVEQIYKNWHSEEVTQKAKSMAEAWSKEINYDTLKQIDEARNLPNKDVEQFLIEKLSQAPQKDEEFQFVFQQLSARANADVIRRTGDKLMDLTPEKIAEGIEITTESILRLRFQFTMVKPLEKPTEEIIRNEANRISRLVAGDTELMQKAYEKVLNQMIHPNSKIQAQLFKKYYDIELTSQEIYDRMQSLGAVWKVDLQAFEKDFRGQLSKEEYEELFEAAVTSKSRYTTALKSVMKDQKIDRFKSLLQKVVDEENPHYADYLAINAF
ncbi:hypothetical protein PCANC_08745 [Puccinia coronata f. sp. avenae]|uniref:EF-hand domain-containing protein n=1 Tax=Puccinia coronata f. sp. avenae TaxID=200324 RepID=A0A2N5T1U9_9BASI|nr:hypothetical protein PCANC_08745 [Puccinia coronata f. sp. avenae]